jgi:tRNA-dihydrouridine synthase B
MGNPYLFKQIEDYNKTGKYSERDKKQQLEDFFEYLKLAERYQINILHIKFHAQAFTKGMKGASQIRNLLGRAKTSAEIKKIMLTVQ